MRGSAGHAGGAFFSFPKREAIQLSHFCVFMYNRGMKIILSPSKKQNMMAAASTMAKELPDREKTLALFGMMRALSKEQLAKTLKIKGSLLEEVYGLYRSFGDGTAMAAAAMLYEGVAFSAIQAEAYDSLQLDFMDRHGTILSAMYGPLDALTPIWPYRLDMTVKPGGLDLYSYWRETVGAYFRGEDLVVDLASGEFSRMLKEAGTPLLKVHFLEEAADGSRKAPSYRVKLARGGMADYLFTGRIEAPERIKDFAGDGYVFDEAASGELDYHFIKPYGKGLAGHD